MNVYIGSQIEIYQPTHTLKAWAKENLTLANPEYMKKLRMGKWLGNTPEYISLYEENGDNLILPFGCIGYIMPFMRPKDFVIGTFRKATKVDYNAKIPLFDYQTEAVDVLEKAHYGILQAPAGSGKTRCGIALTARLGLRTLWLTHTSDLLNQSMESAKEFIDPHLLGTITEGKVRIGKGITFATVQTMCKVDLEKYRNTWDVIIVDECHRVAGTPTSVTMFSKVLNSLCARHKYGLSATVHRADGLVKSTYALLGEIRHIVPDEAVVGRIMHVSIKTLCTHLPVSDDCLDTDGTILYNNLINYITQDDERNRLIVKQLVENADHYNLILSDRVAHLERLMSLLPPEQRKLAVKIDGKMTTKKAKGDRRDALEQMRQGEKRYLFATYQLAKEGLDIPCLDRLHMVTPVKDYAVVAQSVGRIARVAPNKDTPVVYDYVDEEFGYLRKVYKKRCTTYRKLECKFIQEES